MIWSPVMLADELDMLDVRLDAIWWWELPNDEEVIHVIVESPVTHRGVPKPLHLALSENRFQDRDAFIRVITDLPDAENPWVREHAQRDAAWPTIDAMAADEDWVLISDVDEIPSKSLLTRMAKGALPDPCAIRMRVFIYAVDWEVPQEHLPPQCVAATAGYIRKHGKSLAAVRDARSTYPEVAHGGMHFSWLGGPEGQARKLDEKTCHTEMLGTPEADLIRTGGSYRQGMTGQGLPVTRVVVDDSWPPLIRDRKVPAVWFRP